MLKNMPYACYFSLNTLRTYLRNPTQIITGHWWRKLEMEKRIGSLSLFPGRQYGRSNPSNKACMLLLNVNSASQTSLCSCGCDKCQTESRRAAPELTRHGCLKSFVQGPRWKLPGPISRQQDSVFRAAPVTIPPRLCQLFTHFHSSGK